MAVQSTHLLRAQDDLIMQLPLLVRYSLHLCSFRYGCCWSIRDLKCIYVKENDTAAPGLSARGCIGCACWREETFLISTHTTHTLILLRFFAARDTVTGFTFRDNSFPQYYVSQEGGIRVN